MTKCEIIQLDTWRGIPAAIEELLNRKYPHAIGCEHTITRDGPNYIVSVVLSLPETYADTPAPNPVSNKPKAGRDTRRN